LDRNDPYLILLRRELTRAQARLRRAERERDQAIAALVRAKGFAKEAAKRPRKKSARVKRS
jgi:hypothetical protein